MADLEFVQGDTAPDLVATLHEDGDASAPINLTGCTVVFQMRKPDDKRYTVNRSATIEDAVNGVVRYEWGANDLAIPGTYQGQFEVTYSDSKIQTTKDTFSIEVRRQ